MGQKATTILRLTYFLIGSVKLCFEKSVSGDHFYVFTVDSVSQRCRALRPYIPTYTRGRGRESAFHSGMKEHGIQELPFTTILQRTNISVSA